MTLPTAYTEVELATYMHSMVTNDDKVNELTSTLKWSVADGSYNEAVDEALAAYGVTAISSISGLAAVRRLRAAARVELWRLVMQRTVPAYQVSDGQLSTSRNQIHEHARAMYEMFRLEAIEVYGLSDYSNQRIERGGHVAIKVSVV